MLDKILKKLSGILLNKFTTIPPFVRHIIGFGSIYNILYIINIIFPRNLYALEKLFNNRKNVSITSHFRLIFPLYIDYENTELFLRLTIAYNQILPELFYAYKIH